MQMAIGLKTTLHMDYDAALQRVLEALKAEGFGVITEIDVKDTLKKKLDLDFHQYRILGACNPALAHRALTTAPDVGLLLPCNVTVVQADNGVDVAIIDPKMMMSVLPNEGLRVIADEARERLERVIKALEA